MAELNEMPAPWPKAVRIQARPGLPAGRRALQARSAVNLEILRRCFALVGDFIVFDDLPLIQAAEAGLLDSRDMDKHVLSASALRLNKSVPFLRIEPLHSAACHVQVSKLTVNDGVAKVRCQSLPPRHPDRAAAAHDVTGVPIKSRLPTSTPQWRKIS